MVHPLYSVMAFTAAAILCIILGQAMSTGKSQNPVEHSYRVLLAWVIFFSLQDVVWGICGASINCRADYFFLSSTVFHVSAAVTTYFWLEFVLVYMGSFVKLSKLYRGWGALVVLVAVIMTTLNFRYPVIFSIRDGIYCTEAFRPLSFTNQYITYIATGVLAGIHIMTAKSRELRKQWLIVLIFAMAPSSCGFFQLRYPDGPFHTIGYLLACIVIHVFIISKQKEEKLKVISTTDGMTGLLNRRAYDTAIREMEDERMAMDLVYVSMDVNGLKDVNDSLGHQAGDELLKGAADCLKEIFGRYGTVYRIGGDEFSALLECDSNMLQEALTEFENFTSNWKGDFVKEMSISCGVASRTEFPLMKIRELSIQAEMRMYQKKQEYYRKQGIDRKGRREAYSTICHSFQKILKANLTRDLYSIVQLNDKVEYECEKKERPLSQWFQDFLTSGLLHEEDVVNFSEKTNLQYLKKFFGSGRPVYVLRYRRKTEGEFKETLLEIIPAEEFSNEEQIVFLYVLTLE